MPKGLLLCSRKWPQFTWTDVHVHLLSLWHLLSLLLRNDPVCSPEIAQAFARLCSGYHYTWGVRLSQQLLNSLLIPSPPLWILWATSHLPQSWQCLLTLWCPRALSLCFRNIHISLHTLILGIGFLKPWGPKTKVNPCLFNLVDKMDLPLIRKSWVQCIWDLLYYQIIFFLDYSSLSSKLSIKCWREEICDLDCVREVISHVRIKGPIIQN